MGGEPSVHWKKIDAVLQYAKERYPNMTLTSGLTTNAVYMPDEMIQWSIENNVSVYISMDGCRKAHEITRKYKDGRSSFDVVESNVKRYRLARPNADAVRSTFTLTTMSFILESVQYLESLGFKKINMIKASSATDAPWNHKDIALLGNEIDRVGDFIVQRMENNTDLRFNPLSRYLEHVANNRRINRCQAALGYVAIDIHGSIVPCHRFCGKIASDFKCGSVAGDKIVVDLEKLNSFLDINAERYAKLECHKCEAVDFCSNVCPFHYCYAEKDASAIWAECEYSKACLRTAKRMHEYLTKTSNAIYAKHYLAR